MPAYQTSVTQLLRIYHGSKAADSGRLKLPSGKQIQYLCNVGLGPIAFKVYGSEFRQTNQEFFSVLQSADLTTRAIYGQLENASVELAEALQSTGVRPTFLKGISTSDEFYSPPYLRVMSDIDIFVQSSEVDIVMDKIADLGYKISDNQWRLYEKSGHHHLPEARHPQTGVSVEVHTGLFSEAEFYASELVFQPSCIAEQSNKFSYRGIHAARFTPEFQFIFTVSKWSVDRDWAVNIKNINDTIHILRKYESQFEWSTLSAWFESSPHLFPIVLALLHYLEQADIIQISPQMRDVLTSGQHELGSISLKVLLWLLNTYPFNARDKIYRGYMRWCAHALWLYLTRSKTRNHGIPSTLWHQFALSALYGKYNPVGRLLSRLKSLGNREGEK